jgi:chromosome segregation ATPase
MIQSILFFILGFLSAGLLALLVAPAIWRRAVALTRRRIEASLPLSRNELQAQKDGLRAQSAVALRRLELNLKAVREKAANQAVAIGRSREELRQIAGERQERDRRIEELEARAARSGSELSERQEQLASLSGQLAAVRKELAERTAEAKSLGEMYEEASFSSSSRQIELVARESEIDRLASEFKALTASGNETDRRLGELAAERKALEDSLKAERRKVANLERRVERMAAEQNARSDRKKPVAQAANGNGEEQADAIRARLEGEVAALTARLSSLADGAEPDAERLAADRERLESRLKLFTRENKKLRQQIKVLEADDAEGRGDAMLREQINDIAAEMVSLTAMLDGPDSPVHEILAAGKGAEVGNASLADRVRALQERAAQGRS